MKFKTCFSSICVSGYGIGIVKSGMQKYLRRRESSKMKWCAMQMLLFRYGYKNENEKKIGKAIFSNLINRIIVMLDEELCFDDWKRYLKVRSLIDLLKKEEDSLEKGIEILYKICDVMCSGRIIRLGSDIGCYFGKRVFETGDGNIEMYRMVDCDIIYEGKAGDSQEYKDCMRNFIGWFNQKDSRCYYWLMKLYLVMGKGQVRRYHRKDMIYGVWEYMEGLIGVNENLRRLFEYRLEKFYEKEKMDRKLFLIGCVNLIMYRDDIDWNEKIKWFQIEEEIDEKMVIDDYCIDMHCQEGRKMGKNKEDFVNEGSLVVNEYMKYKVDEWREYYHFEKLNDPKVVKGKKGKKGKKEKVKTEKVKKVKTMIHAEDKNGDLEFISMSDLEFVRLCSNSVCGGKVMCFIVKYEGELYVMKEGRKSMNYNVDYDMVDKCKEIFGLNHIGMRRIKSDRVVERINKKQKAWENNFVFVEKVDVIYCMMKCIDGGIKFIDYMRKLKLQGEEVKKELYREYMKIGLWRGIFGVSDFSSINVMIQDEKLISIDEHGLLGSRVNMIGEKNMKVYKENSKFIEEVFHDLYSNKSEKKKYICEVMKKYGFEKEVEKVIGNYESLRERFDEEYSK